MIWFGDIWVVVDGECDFDYSEDVVFVVMWEEEIKIWVDFGLGVG